VASPTAVAQRVEEHTLLVSVLAYDAADAADRPAGLPRSAPVAVAVTMNRFAAG
jgi:hypothetical protein